MDIITRLIIVVGTLLIIVLPFALVFFVTAIMYYHEAIKDLAGKEIDRKLGILR
jgi:hypothetical protein